MRHKTKARDIVACWPWSRSTHGYPWRPRGGILVMLRLERIELDISDAEWRLAKMAIANGLTLEGYRDTNFVRAVQEDIKFEHWLATRGPIKEADLL